MSDKSKTPETLGDDPVLAEQWGDGRTPAETGQVGAPDFDPKAYQPYGEDDKPPTEAGTPVADTDTDAAKTDAKTKKD